jgi:hypothetical protein
MNVPSLDLEPRKGRAVHFESIPELVERLKADAEASDLLGVAARA